MERRGRPMAVPTSFCYFTLKKVPTSESRVSVLMRVSEFTSVSVVACGGSPHAKKMLPHGKRLKETYCRRLTCHRRIEGKPLLYCHCTSPPKAKYKYSNSRLTVRNEHRRIFFPLLHCGRNEIGTMRKHHALREGKERF